MATRSKKAPEQKTLGALTDELWLLREKKRDINEQLKMVEGQMEGITSELLERLEKEGLDKIAGSHASLTVTPSINPQITDWDAFIAWTVKTKQFQTLRRQINPEPWRELMEQRKGVVPGTVAFIKKTLNMRTIS